MFKTDKNIVFVLPTGSTNQRALKAQTRHLNKVRR